MADSVEHKIKSLPGKFSPTESNFGSRDYWQIFLLTFRDWSGKSQALLTLEMLIQIPRFIRFCRLKYIFYIFWTCNGSTLSHLVLIIGQFKRTNRKMKYWSAVPLKTRQICDFDPILYSGPVVMSYTGWKKGSMGLSSEEYEIGITSRKLRGQWGRV